MRQLMIVTTALLGLAACDTKTTHVVTVERLPLMGGYRQMGDECVRVGENAETNQYLDDAADLVACPVDYEGVGVFVTETSAVQVGESQGYILYSVPIR